MAKRTFTREFRLEAVKPIRERGVSMAQASRDLDIQLNVLLKSVTDANAKPARAFPGPGQMKAGQAEISKLRKEVAKVKMERDIVKDAAACFAKDST
jgi:transposase